MLNRKKLLALALSAALTLSLAACGPTGEKPSATPGTTPSATPSAPAATGMKAGDYTATVTGHNAPMTIKVSVSEDAITAIDTSENLETVGVGQVALDQISKAIVDSQTVGVDAVTGATISSMALVSAVKKCLTDAGADMAAFSAEAPAPAPLNDTYEADVVIIGGGGAGLAAALSAEQGGASVIVVEKLGLLGGSTNVSEGALNAVDPTRQGAQGIEDSVEKFNTQTLEGGHNIGDPILVDYMTKNALAAVEWMESVGVQFKETVGTATGALWQRSHYPSTPSGNSYIRVFEEYIASHDGIQVLMNTPATALVQDASGKVTGVVCENGGKEVTINAKNGVIIATGGFGANVELRQQVNDGVWADVKLDNSIGTTNMMKSAQGDGITMGEVVGAQVIGMSDIQLHPCGTPGTGLMENIRTSGRNRLFVNSDGDRFVNEGAARDALCKAIFAQKDSTYYIVVNALRYPDRDWVDANGSTIANMVAQGSVIEADTLAELAEKTGMDAAKLQAAVDGYNAVVRGETEDALGFKADNEADKEMLDGPWYACKKVPTVHHTMGGLKINVDTQVLGADDQPIPGLYAAGEVTGGIHGSNRLGGNAIADCMVFGQVAGRTAANNK